MDSGFFVQDYEKENDRIELERKGSSRYAFYKARLYGMLHFVKRAAPGYENDLITVESLLKEFMCGYALSHPNIVRYLRYEGGEIYEEYIDGSTLREMIDTGDSRLDDEEKVSNICRQLLSAVDYLHSQGVVHNDLKPENVMVSRIGDTVKVIDLSCAQSAMHDSTPGYTEEYRVPELDETSHAPCSATTDYYHIGRIMEELAEGRKFVKRWKPFISKATDADPASRLSSAEEGYALIPRIGKRRKGHWITTGIATVLVIGMLATGLFVFLRKMTPGSYEIVTVDSLPSTQSLTTAAEMEANTKDSIEEKNPAIDIERENKSATIASTDGKEKILKDINHYIEELYSREVRPVVDNMNLDDVPGQLSDRHYDAVRVALKKAITMSRAYGDAMQKKYPEWEDAISTHTISKISMQQSLYGELLYSNYQSLPDSESTDSLVND